MENLWETPCFFTTWWLFRIIGRMSALKTGWSFSEHRHFHVGMVSIILRTWPSHVFLIAPRGQSEIPWWSRELKVVDVPQKDGLLTHLQHQVILGHVDTEGETHPLGFRRAKVSPWTPIPIIQHGYKHLTTMIDLIHHRCVCVLLEYL